MSSGWNSRKRLARTRANTSRIGLVVALVVGGVIYFGAGGQLPFGAVPDNVGEPINGSSVAGGTPAGSAAGASEAGGASSSPSIPADATTMTVEHVHDGDTLFLVPTGTAQSMLKVRLIGVDTPELDRECHAETARDALRAMLPNGAEVRAAHDTDPQDRYGRELLYVWDSTGTLVNLELVRAGHGTALRVGANDAHWGALQAAEASARSAGLGLWGAC